MPVIRSRQYPLVLPVVVPPSSSSSPSSKAHPESERTRSAGAQNNLRWSTCFCFRSLSVGRRAVRSRRKPRQMSMTCSANNPHRAVFCCLCIIPLSEEWSAHFACVVPVANDRGSGAFVGGRHCVCARACTWRVHRVRPLCTRHALQRHARAGRLEGMRSPLESNRTPDAMAAARAVRNAVARAAWRDGSAGRTGSGRENFRAGRRQGSRRTQPRGSHSATSSRDAGISPAEGAAEHRP
jgi:hypothetical protein